MLFVRDFVTDQRVFRASKAPERPTVSVILPTWRRRAGGSLQRAIESVLSQSFGDLELIVVDDGSADGTADLLAEIQRADPRLVHVRHELNCGLPALRVNEGIELARGEWIAFQFDDDEWLDGALEALVAAARETAEPSLVCGASLLVGPGEEERELPGAEVNLLTLSFQNRIANNAALLPRAAFAICGLYDPHVGMRRFCDWDLWIRCAHRLPVVAVDRRVSKVHVASDAAAIGVTAPADQPLFRYLNAIPRDHLLSPERWRDYEVDGLAVGEVEVLRDLRRRLEEEHVRPFHRRLRHAFPQLSPPPPSPPAPPVRSLAFALDSYYPSVELCLGHYDLPCYRRGLAKMFYRPLFQIGPSWGRDIDLLLLVRTISEAAVSVAKDGLLARLPVGFYLDDDLLTLHEYGPPYDTLLRPGAPRHQSLLEQLAQVDAVWATRPVIAESVRPHNPRILPHNG